MFAIKTFSEKVQPLILCTIIAASIGMMLDIGIVQNTQVVYAQDNNLSNSSSNSSSEISELVTNNVADIEQVLGQPFYTENTKSTNTRVLNVDKLPTVEISYNGNSTINGSPTQTIGTVIDKMGSDGAVHSEGQAIILTATGQVITYKSQSIGYYNPDGSFSDSGIILFGLPFHNSTQQNSNNVADSQSNMNEDTNYSEFNNLLGIYKKTVDPLGNGLTKVWKWG